MHSPVDVPVSSDVSAAPGFPAAPDVPAAPASPDVPVVGETRGGISMGRVSRCCSLLTCCS